MSLLILRDSGPLGLVTNPRNTPETSACGHWIQAMVARGRRVLVPEVTNYEARRELLRAGRAAGIRILDELKARIGYEPIRTETMVLGAEYWASARRRGRPTACDDSLDADMILVAQAGLLQSATIEVIIASDNIRHLSLFADARPWQEIDRTAAAYIAPSPCLCSQYSRLSASASQEASITSVELPTVRQMCVPSVDSIRARTEAAVPPAPSRMRTL